MNTILRKPEVMARTGLSHAQIYKLLASGEFPKQVPLGGRIVGWVEREIDEWVDGKIAERDQFSNGHGASF